MSDPLIVDCYAFSGIDRQHWSKLGSAPPAPNGSKWCGAIVKCTEGVLTRSSPGWKTEAISWFGRNWNAIREAGGDRYGRDYFRGAYHYLIIRGGDQKAQRESGREQAKHFLDVIEKSGGWGVGDLWPVVDVEEGSGNKDASLAAIQATTHGFTDTIRELTGRDTMLYAGWWAVSKGLRDHLGCALLWYASYTSNLNGAKTWGALGWPLSKLWGWQYCGNGEGWLKGYPTVTPIASKIDINAIVLQHKIGDLVVKGTDATRSLLWAEHP